MYVLSPAQRFSREKRHRTLSRLRRLAGHEQVLEITLCGELDKVMALKEAARAPDCLELRDNLWQLMPSMAHTWHGPLTSGIGHWNDQSEC